MSGKIPQATLRCLADKIRQSPSTIQNLTFADSATAVTAVRTADLRFDVHKSTENQFMATGIIQANSEAKDKSVRKFLKGKTGGHRGTHQIIGEKIRFNLGYSFDVEAVAAAVENPYDIRLDTHTKDGASGESGSGSGYAGSSSDWVWWANEGIWHRQRSGIDEWRAPESDADSDWIYSTRQRKYFVKHASGAVSWAT